MDYKEFLNVALKALVHSLLTLLKFIFLTPFNLWVKACNNLANQKEQGYLEMKNITGLWPFFSYLKRFLLDFAFDALAFLAYPLGIIVGLYSWIEVGFNEYLSFSDGFQSMVLILLGAYFSPLFFAIVRDLFNLLLIPFRKFLNWGSKPAQFLEIQNTTKPE